MNLNFTFDPTQIELSQGGQNLPIGMHTVMIVDSEGKASQNNASSGYLQFTLEVCDQASQHFGMRHTFRINLWYVSPDGDLTKQGKVIDIANQELAKLCFATVNRPIQDSNELHGIPFKVLIREQKNNPEYTEVGDIFFADGSAIRSQRGVQQTQQPPTVAQQAPPVQQPQVQQVQQAPPGMQPPPNWGTGHPAQQASSVNPAQFAHNQPGGVPVQQPPAQPGYVPGQAPQAVQQPQVQQPAPAAALPHWMQNR